MLFICIGSTGSSAKSCLPLFSTLQLKSATIHWSVDPYDDARTKYIILPTTDSYQWYLYPYNDDRTESTILPTTKSYQWYLYSCDDARTKSIILPTTASYEWYFYPCDDAKTESTILPSTEAGLIDVTDFYLMYLLAILLEPMSIQPCLQFLLVHVTIDGMQHFFLPFMHCKYCQLVHWCTPSNDMSQNNDNTQLL